MKRILAALLVLSFVFGTFSSAKAQSGGIIEIVEKLVGVLKPSQKYFGPDAQNPNGICEVTVWVAKGAIATIEKLVAMGFGPNYVAIDFELGEEYVMYQGYFPGPCNGGSGTAPETSGGGENGGVKPPSANLFLLVGILVAAGLLLYFPLTRRSIPLHL